MKNNFCKLKHYVIIYLFLFFLHGCEGCEYFERKRKLEECYFRIDSIEIQGARFLFIGKFKSQLIYLQSHSYMEKYTEKGDSISKTKGSTEFLLIKKDTTMSFIFDCDNQNK